MVGVSGSSLENSRRKGNVMGSIRLRAFNISNISRLNRLIDKSNGEIHFKN